MLTSFECPTNIYSASLHPDKSCFVAGGEELWLFKFDYKDGKELGKSNYKVIIIILKALSRNKVLVKVPISWSGILRFSNI